MTFSVVAVATAGRMVFSQALGDRSPFSLFYPAIILTALYGGWAWGGVAMVLSTLSSLF
jgi:hypothetical protein